MVVDGVVYVGVAQPGFAVSVAVGAGGAGSVALPVGSAGDPMAAAVRDAPSFLMSRCTRSPGAGCS
jgi:hypothetical protein